MFFENMNSSFKDMTYSKQKNNCLLRDYDLVDQKNCLLENRLCKPGSGDGGTSIWALPGAVRPKNPRGPGPIYV